MAAPLVGFTELMVILFLMVLILIPYWRIFSKAGFPGWMSLSLLIPPLNVLVLLYLAFTEWPIEKELKKLRESP